MSIKLHVFLSLSLAARVKINEEFKKHKSEASPEKIEEVQ